MIKHIERQDWETIRVLLSAHAHQVVDNIADESSFNKYDQSVTCKKENERKLIVAFRSRFKTDKHISNIQDEKRPSFALHQACQFAAPADIILTLISILPKSAAQRESTRNEYPLHIAARKGLAVDVIEALVDEFPQALTAQDSNGRTPLHLSCLSGHIYPYLATVFCERLPSVIAIEDDNGSTPMELFMHSDISQSRFAHNCMDVLDILHRASSLYWRNRRRQNEMYRMTTMRKVKRASLRFDYGSSCSCLSWNDLKLHP